MSAAARETAEYRSWKGMKTRCTNPNRPDWKNYGGRGISVCERWATSFANFLADVGPKPSPGLTIDRIDNDGNYTPGNVRWATREQQIRNSRPRPKKPVRPPRTPMEVPPMDHIKISLPPQLRDFVQRQAAEGHRSFAGQIRFLLDEAARRANGVAHSPLPPAPTSSFPVLPNVEGNLASIADARDRIAQMHQERAQIEQRRRAYNGSAVDDRRDAELASLLRFVERQIELAEQRMTRHAV